MKRLMRRSVLMLVVLLGVFYFSTFAHARIRVLAGALVTSQAGFDSLITLVNQSDLDATATFYFYGNNGNTKERRTVTLTGQSKQVLFSLSNGWLNEMGSLTNFTGGVKVVIEGEEPERVVGDIIVFNSPFTTNGFNVPLKEPDYIRDKNSTWIMPFVATLDEGGISTFLSIFNCDGASESNFILQQFSFEDPDDDLLSNLAVSVDSKTQNLVTRPDPDPPYGPILPTFVPTSSYTCYGVLKVPDTNINVCGVALAAFLMRPSQDSTSVPVVNLDNYSSENGLTLTRVSNQNGFATNFALVNYNLNPVIARITFYKSQGVPAYQEVEFPSKEQLIVCCGSDITFLALNQSINTIYNVGALEGVTITFDAVEENGHCAKDKVVGTGFMIKDGSLLEYEPLAPNAAGNVIPDFNFNSGLETLVSMFNKGNETLVFNLVFHYWNNTSSAWVDVSVPIPPLPPHGSDFIYRADDLVEDLQDKYGYVTIDWVSGPRNDLSIYTCFGDAAFTSFGAFISDQGYGGYGEAPLLNGAVENGVNLWSGEYSRTEVDLVVQSAGLPIVCARTYSSNNICDGPMGMGWHFGYDKWVKDLGDVIIFYDGTGRHHLFTQTHREENSGVVTTTYQGPTTLFPKLIRVVNGSTATFTIPPEKNDVTHTFYTTDYSSLDQSRKYHITEMSDTLGRKLVFEYDDDGLKYIKSKFFNGTNLTDCRTVTITYNTTTPAHIWKITLDTTHEYVYTYTQYATTGKYELTQVDLPGTKPDCINYTYVDDPPNIAHLLEKVYLNTDEDLPIVENEYNVAYATVLEEYYGETSVDTYYVNYKVTSQMFYVDADEEYALSASYEYGFLVDPDNPNLAASWKNWCEGNWPGADVKYTDPNGTTYYYKFNNVGNPLQVTVCDYIYDENATNHLSEDPVPLTTFLEYNSDMQVTLVKYPAGNGVKYLYDEREWTNGHCPKGNLLYVWQKEVASQFPDVSAAEFDPGDYGDDIITAMTYTACNRPAIVTDPEGRTVEYKYENQNNNTTPPPPFTGDNAVYAPYILWKVTGPNDAYVEYTNHVADANGPIRVTKVNAAGPYSDQEPNPMVTTSYEYYGGGVSAEKKFRPNTVTLDPSGLNHQSSINDYSPLGSAIETQNYLGNITGVEVDNFDRPTEINMPTLGGGNSYKRLLVYDGNGNVETNILRYDSTTQVTIGKLEYAHDNQGRNFGTTVFGWNGFIENPSAAPAGTSRTFDGTRPSINTRPEKCNGLNYETKNEYYARGLIKQTSVRTASGEEGFTSTSTNYYDKNGRPRRTDACNSEVGAITTISGYDGFNRVKWVTQPDPSNPSVYLYAVREYYRDSSVKSITVCSAKDLNGNPAGTVYSHRTFEYHPDECYDLVTDYVIDSDGVLWANRESCTKIVTRTEYFLNGQVKKVVEDEGTGHLNRTSEYDYYKDGQPKSSKTTIDTAGHYVLTTWTYEKNKSLNADGSLNDNAPHKLRVKTTVEEWDEALGTSGGYVTLTSYVASDEMGREIVSKDPAGKVTRREYSHNYYYDIVTITDAENKVTTVFYDHAGRQAWTCKKIGTTSQNIGYSFYGNGNFKLSMKAGQGVINTVADNEAVTDDVIGKGVVDVFIYDLFTTWKPIIPDSVVINFKVGTEDRQLVDNATGVLNGTGLQSGSVNYDTGKVHLVFTTGNAPNVDSEIKASYTNRYAQSQPQFYGGTPKNHYTWTPNSYLQVDTEVIGANAIGETYDKSTTRAYAYYLNGAGPVHTITTTGWNDDSGSFVQKRTRYVEYVRDVLLQVQQIKIGDNSQLAGIFSVPNNPGVATAYEYSHLGAVTTQTEYDPDGSSYNTITLENDSLGRLQSEGLSINGGDSLETQLTNYDTLSRLGNIIYPGGTELKFNYGSSLLGRINTLQIKNGGNYLDLASYKYVGLGRVRTRNVYNNPGTTSLHSDLTVNYLPNAVVPEEWLNTMTGGPQTDVAKYAYGYNNVYSRTYKQDLLATGNQYEVYGYDDLHRLTGVKYAANDYYDASHNPTNPEHPENTGYNSPSIDTYSRQTTFNLDIVGNRDNSNGVTEDADGSGEGAAVNIPYASNEVNEYTTAGAASPTHSFTGNLIDDDAHLYYWDHKDRLATQWADGNSNGIIDNGETADFAYDYDAQNRRVTKTVGSSTAKYYYLGWRCIQERDSADNITAEYLHGNNLDEILQMRVPGDGLSHSGTTYAVNNDDHYVEIPETFASHAFSGKIITLDGVKYTIADNITVVYENVSYTRIFFADTPPTLSGNTTYAIDTGGIFTYHTDAQGNVVAMTNALGTLIEKMQYDAYGRLTALWTLAGGPISPVNGFISTETYYSDSITGNPYLFQSQRLDPETGLYYFKNRYYDPVHGRFISRDPEGFIDGPNLYAFVNNNPINFVDPLGLACEVLPPSWFWEVSGGGGELDFLWGAASSVSGFGAAVMGGMILETVFCGPQMAATWDPELYVYLNTPPRFDGFYYPSQEESDQAYLNHISKKSYLEMSDGELKFVWEHAPGRFGLFWYQAQTDKVNAAWQKEHPGCDIFFAVMADPDLRKELDDKSLPLFIQSQGEEAQKAGYELVEKMRRLQQAIDNYASGS